MLKLVFPVLVALFAVGAAAQMTGGFSTIDKSDEGAQNALNFAVAEHNRRRNDLYLSQVKDVVSVQRQLVAGYKYVISVNMARTTCRKNSATEECPFHTDPTMARTYKCVFTVWSRPWLRDIQVLKAVC